MAQLDRAEAMAKLKIAQAVVKEKQALLKRSGSGDAVDQAQVEAAEARAELAQLELDRLTLRAPFAGRVLSVPVSSGQFVLKGTVLAEVADVSRVGRSCRLTAGVSRPAPTRRCSSRSKSSRPRCRASCRCSKRSRSFESWPRPTPRPGFKCLIPMRELEPGLRRTQRDLAQHAHRRGAQGIAEEGRGCRRLTGLTRSGDPQ